MITVAQRQLKLKKFDETKIDLSQEFVVGKKGKEFLRRGGEQKKMMRGPSGATRRTAGTWDSKCRLQF
jgi:hypothetical protein